MNVLSHADAFQVLLLRAAEQGRGDVLFGESLTRAREALLPFMVGEAFPSTYLEYPLRGEPFLDVTVLYETLPPHTRIASDTVAGMEGLIDWCSEACRPFADVSFGFEVDTKDPRIPAAAVHFQPRRHTELVEPFCAALGEPERATRYLDMAARMPHGWPLSFFGLFRGRPGSPMRICGYLDASETRACAEDSSRVGRAFDHMGFSAYDEAMLKQVGALLDAAPGYCDFQFDVHPDGHLGKTFAIDVRFEIAQPAAVHASFEDGPAAKVLQMLERWGIADRRWCLAADASFARSLPVELDDGGAGRYAFVLMPQWVKVRWADGELQPAKLYLYANAGLLDDRERA